jgi:hypothetical protein
MTDINAFANAIASIESGGRYDLLGPATRSGDRAYGKYQVMGQNVGPWTKEVLGQSLTPQQFLANPQAQDAVFQHQFGKALARYGNPQDAASVWFSGRPLAQSANLKDVLGTTGAAYVDKFNRALGAPGSLNAWPPAPSTSAVLPNLSPFAPLESPPNLPLWPSAPAAAPAAPSSFFATLPANPMQRMLQANSDAAIGLQNG